MDREQLVEELRRQIEEDYRLDIEALERLRGHHNGGANAAFSATPSSSVSTGAYSTPSSHSAPASAYSSPSSHSAPGNAYAMPSKWSEEVESPSPASAPSEDQRDQQLVGSLRTMFTSGRK